MSASDNLVFRYVFHFPEGPREFALELDPRTLALRGQPPAELPEWTRLGYHRCPNCPLDERSTPRCPIAVNVSGVIEAFRDRISHEEMEVEVVARGRSYGKTASLQEALSAMLGIFMVSSGCPVLNKLRPMVATHLPFMSAEESTYRTVSMYLMAQMFVAREGGVPDWELAGLVGFLQEIRDANTGFCRRVQSLGLRDASINALYRLNALGEITSMTIVDDDLARWREVFAAHYADQVPPRG